MSKKILWMMVSGLMVLSLVIAACGPAAPTSSTPTSPTTPAAPATQQTPTTPAASAAPVEKEVVKPGPETPKYGGTLDFVLTGDVTTFDEAPGPGFHAGATTLKLTNGVLIPGDWTKGPAGGYGTKKTGWDWAGPVPAILGLEGGGLAESYETVEPGHWIFHIRQGVHYAINSSSDAARLVGGRVFDAKDAAFALKRYLSSSGSYIYRTYPGLRTGANVTVKDQWTLEIKVPPEMAIDAIAMFLGFSTVDTPPEVIAKYGSQTDWKNSVGTGPFILTDYVPGSTARLVRNPNYWGTDPLGPGKGNKLPYLDGVSYIVLPDVSTRMAALRTGKIDMMTAVTRDDGNDMIKRSPQLKYVKYPGSSVNTAMRTDKAPFNDIRVRRAMMMSIDYKTIINSLFGGDAPILTWPIKPNREFLDAYLSLDDPEMPATVKELYIYNPDKAKQLLKDAGFPNGFKTSVILTSVNVDYASVLKDMWSKVGIDVNLDVKETGAFNTLTAARNYDGLSMGFSAGAEGALYQLIRMRGEGVTNQSYINDPSVDKASQAMQLVVLTDRAQANRIYRDLLKYVLDQAWMIPLPQDKPYTFWWPWVKNYSGEVSVGYFDGESWTKYVWLDQDLKKTMGY